MTDFVERYKDTPGVLMFAFGNESNYGLSWSSFEIETCRLVSRTRSRRVFSTACSTRLSRGQKVAPDHLFTIVNGDIQYIDLIKELVTRWICWAAMPIAGRALPSLWADVDEKLDLPVVFFEFGSDAFNARDFPGGPGRTGADPQGPVAGDVQQGTGNGEEGNSDRRLCVRVAGRMVEIPADREARHPGHNASWSNQAYLFDWAEGQNNMNEEWFGIMALGPPNLRRRLYGATENGLRRSRRSFSIDPYPRARAKLTLICSYRP